jgi:Flp pilus assembly protein TadB
MFQQPVCIIGSNVPKAVCASPRRKWNIGSRKRRNGNDLRILLTYRPRRSRANRLVRRLQRSPTACSVERTRRAKIECVENRTSQRELEQAGFHKEISMRKTILTATALVLYSSAVMAQSMLTAVAAVTSAISAPPTAYSVWPKK